VINLKNNAIYKLTLSAACLAVCMVLPLATFQMQNLGKMFCLIHIGVLFCGFLCGWKYGLAVGIIAPIMRSFIFGMPALYPQAVSMSFELGIYGLLTAVFYKLFPKKIGYIYLSLIIAMICGRIVKGIANYFFYTANGNIFTLKMFIYAEFVTPILGIIIQLVVIPPIVKIINGKID